MNAKISTTISPALLTALVRIYTSQDGRSPKGVSHAQRHALSRRGLIDVEVRPYFAGGDSFWRPKTSPTPSGLKILEERRARMYAGDAT